MDKSKKYLAISFIVVLIAVIILSFVGMFLLKDKPVILQGQIEATEIRISGKLPGRIDTFLVEEGQNVKAGDTLVVINSASRSLPLSSSSGTNRSRTSNWQRPPTTVLKSCIGTALFLRNGETK